MNIQQRIYEDAQNASGLRVGDWVRVVDPEMEIGESWGSTYTWSEIKQKMIGQIVQITNILEDGIQINNDFIFPYFALEKLSYAEAQEASGLKVGDWVKITREAEDYEGGWGMQWRAPIIHVGKIGRINLIGNKKGIRVNLENENVGHYFPYFVLEKVSAPKPENKEHEFKPFDKVLVRDSKGEVWKPDIFLYIHREMILDNEYRCAGGLWEKCIPYEGNEHLVGTTDMPE